LLQYLSTLVSRDAYTNLVDIDLYLATQTTTNGIVKITIALLQCGTSAGQYSSA